MSVHDESELREKVLPAAKSNWKLVLLGCLIFVCGMLAGAGGTVILVRSAVMKSVNNPQLAIERAGKRLKNKLNLREDQIGPAQTILKNRMQELMKIRRTARADVATQLYLFRDEILPLLDKAQARSFETIFKRICRTFPAPLKAPGRDINPEGD